MHPDERLQGTLIVRRRSIFVVNSVNEDRLALEAQLLVNPFTVYYGCRA